jgi:hypothetical protein
VDELIEKADGFAGVFPGDFSCLIINVSLSLSLSLKDCAFSAPSPHTNFSIVFLPTFIFLLMIIF